MNAHRDPPFTYKFVAITADNAHEAQPFTGAELVLLDGIVGVEIGPCDVLIMDGSRYHGVAPLRSLPGTHFKTQPMRHSLVHFTRSMHMEAPLGKHGRGSSRLRQRERATYCRRARHGLFSLTPLSTTTVHWKVQQVRRLTRGNCLVRPRTTRRYDSAACVT